jgi:hypothetical protein
MSANCGPVESFRMWAAGCQIDWRYNSITEQLIEVKESYWMRGEHPSALGWTRQCLQFPHKNVNETLMKKFLHSICTWYLPLPRLKTQMFLAPAMRL